MTIFNTNPSEGGSGGDYDFFNDAPLGTYGAFPRSLIENHPKWHTGFTGQLIPPATYPELDALPDFNLPEQTNNVFTIGGTFSDIAGDKTFCYTENNKFYKIQNTNPIQIFEATWDENTSTETETLYLDLVNLTLPIFKYAAISDDETEMLIYSTTNPRLYHYDIVNDVLTNIDVLTIGDPTIQDDDIISLRWNQNLGKFTVLGFNSSSTLNTYFIENAVLSKGGTVTGVGRPTQYNGNMEKAGTKNYMNGKYYFTDRNNKKLYSLDENDFSTLIDEYTFPNLTTNYAKNACCENGLIVFQSDYDFTNKIIQLSWSVDGSPFTEHFYTQSSAPTSQAPNSVLPVAKDYVLVAHKNGTGSNQTKYYRVNLVNNSGGSVFATTLVSTTETDDAPNLCVAQNGISYLTSTLNEVDLWRRDFSGGDGLSMPPLEFNEFPDQFIYGLKHTS